MAVESMRHLVVCLATLLAVNCLDASKSLADETGVTLELASTMKMLKTSVESLGVTLIPIDIEGGNQYYSRYIFNYNGCAVSFSYDFDYFDRQERRQKTARFPFSFNLQEEKTPVLAPFYLTHISNQVYTVEGKGFRIPVASIDEGERIVRELDTARRLCRMRHEEPVRGN